MAGSVDGCGMSAGSPLLRFDPPLPVWPAEGCEGNVLAVEGRDAEFVVSMSASVR